MIYFMIFLGAGLGGLTRFCISNFIKSLWGGELPLATLIVNVSGCFLMGFLVSYLIQRNMHSTFFGREILLIGFLGGYTTFSTFSIEALELVYKQLWWYATAYIGGHFIFTLLGCALGINRPVFSTVSPAKRPVDLTVCPTNPSWR